MKHKNNGPVAFIAAIFAAIVILVSAGACNNTGPACPAGQTAEHDDDGWECEPDSDGNGVDDEDDSDD